MTQSATSTLVFDPSSRSAVADRLEYVRQKSGVATLTEFYQRVFGASYTGAYRPTYWAIRHYHSGQRKVDARYLARVAEVFGTPIPWLITGEGAPTTAVELSRPSSDPADDSAVRDLLPRVLARLVAGLDLPPADALPLAYPFMAALERLLEGARDLPATVTADQAMGYADTLFDFLFAPGRLWGFDVRNVARRRRVEFAMSMIHTLTLVLPEPGRGDFISRRGLPGREARLLRPDAPVPFPSRPV